MNNFICPNTIPAVWDGIKIMSDMQQHGQPSNRLSPLGGKADGAFAEEMNSFYSRFDTHDFHSAINGIDSSTKTDGKLEIEEKDVLRIFQRTNVRKSPGPDGISGHVLKTCASQLSGIFRSIFQASLSLHTIPILWKTSTVVPVPKKAHPVIPNDFRPIALTSHEMKSFEKNHQNYDYEPHSPSSRPSAISISAGERGGGCSHYSAKYSSWSS